MRRSVLALTSISWTADQSFLFHRREHRGHRAGPAVGNLRHVFTHRDATVSVFRARGRVDTADARWVRADELASLPLSTFGRKTIALRSPDSRPRRAKTRAQIRQ